VATFVASAAAAVIASPGFAAGPQDPPPTPPAPATPAKETRENGPEFPKPEIKAQKPSAQQATPVPGQYRPEDLAAQPLTLARAIDLALQLQPDVAAAQANREASEQRVTQAQANYYPNVSPTYNYRSQYTFGTRNQFINGVVIPVQSGTTVTNRLGDIGADLTLFDSFRREYGAQQARQNLRSSLFSEQNTRQVVIADVANNYFNALRQDALVRVQEAQVARAQNTLDVVRAQVEVGTARRIDIYQAEADLLNAQVALVRSRNNAEVAQAQLKNALGIIGGERLRLADVPAPSPQTPTTAALEEGTKASDAPASPAPTQTDAELIDRYANLAFRLRPDVAQSVSNVESNQTAVKLARINNGLQVTTTLSGAYQYAPSTGNNRLLSLGLSYPLFNAGLTRAQVRASQAQVRASEANLTGQRQQVAVEVEQSYRTLAQSRAAIPAAEAAQRAAQINYEAAIESRREGVGSIVDVITAQTSLVQAQINYVQAVYDFYAADAALARAVGQADRIAREGAVTPDNQTTTPLVNPVVPAVPATPANPNPVQPSTPGTPAPTNPAPAPTPQH
jgi:outer membrane protein